MSASVTTRRPERCREGEAIPSRCQPITETGRTLEREYDFDVFSLIREGLADLPDHEIFELAHRTHRIVITRDRDFAQYFYRTRRYPPGVIYLDLPNHLRTVTHITAILRRFFDNDVAQVQFDDVLVVITETGARIDQGPRRIK
jgi:predicted nuclease of predicted toxin-antitoxin system